MTEWMLRVSAPHYVAAIVFNGSKPITAAPILYWVVKQNWSPEQCINYFNRKNFQWEVLHAYSQK
jgi:hypothetical protein